jgi:2-methylcitrate dehydratase PrpD
MNENVELTRAMARYATGSRYDALPDEVQREATRAVLNWIGVAIGGCREEAVTIAASFVAEKGATSRATAIGQGLKTDVGSAAFLNCIASSVLAYDDAHLPSVAHPSGPAASALLALAQTRVVPGEEFLNALALGIEIQCRIANMLVLPPATFDPNIYVNGYSGPIGVALAAGRLLGLDERRMRSAVGIAASQASGFRATHGTMTAHFRPGHASQAGIIAALLAAKGFDCTDNALEAPGGFLDVYAPGADGERALADLGTRHEMLANRYKPYPCGILIHPIIDACLEIRSKFPLSSGLARIRLRVNPLVLSLTGLRSPRTSLESHVSVYHWAAAALLRGKAGLAETQIDCLEDPDIVALRDRIEAVSQSAIDKGEALAAVTLVNGTVVDAHVVNARGSQVRPMTNRELDVKFTELTERMLSRDAAEKLRESCWQVATMADAGMEIGNQLP